MRHQVFGRKLGRDINARKALLRNLSSSLVVEGSIVTTLTKAKFVKGFVEKLITGAKGDLARHRDLSSQLTHVALIKLINEVGPGFKNRSGGYTRITKLGSRLGDAAPMAKLELLDYDKSLAKTVTKKPKPSVVKAKPAKVAKNQEKGQDSKKNQTAKK